MTLPTEPTAITVVSDEDDAHPAAFLDVGRHEEATFLDMLAAASFAPV